MASSLSSHIPDGEDLNEKPFKFYGDAYLAEEDFNGKLREEAILLMSMDKMTWNWRNLHFATINSYKNTFIGWWNYTVNEIFNKKPIKKLKDVPGHYR